MKKNQQRSFLFHRLQFPREVDVGSLGINSFPVSVGACFRRPEKTLSTGRLPLIYAVDDWPALTALYSAVLDPVGYRLRTFNNRAEALEEILSLDTSPSLLITDYAGYPISAELLMRCCRIAEPKLKILMVSGYDESCLDNSPVKPDRFLPKPFTLHQLKAEVAALLYPGCA